MLLMEPALPTPPMGGHSAAEHDNSDSPTRTHSSPNRRTKTVVACRRCNAKKVKCTASEGVPCARCVAANAECVLINSQRGKYVVQRRAHMNATLKLGAQIYSKTKSTSKCRRDRRRWHASRNPGLWSPRLCPINSRNCTTAESTRLGMAVWSQLRSNSFKRNPGLSGDALCSNC